MAGRILYAAIADDGTPAINVWSWDRKALETLVADRIANGDAFPGEMVYRGTVTAYDARLKSYGLPARNKPAC